MCVHTYVACDSKGKFQHEHLAAGRLSFPMCIFTHASMCLSQLPRALHIIHTFWESNNMTASCSCTCGYTASTCNAHHVVVRLSQHDCLSLLHEKIPANANWHVGCILLSVCLSVCLSFFLTVCLAVVFLWLNAPRVHDMFSYHDMWINTAHSLMYVYEYTNTYEITAPQAPELLLEVSSYDYAVDMWGAGCAFAAMVSNPLCIYVSIYNMSMCVCIYVCTYACMHLYLLFSLYDMHVFVCPHAQIAQTLNPKP